ncbi:hypothetical protein [Lacticaseibacillus jixiensis]|uniref:hypothetical protein n=1 Tax=Lacticaseibacillus jixiensis TaxID=3231926 RepID=UPI0036F2A5EA
MTAYTESGKAVFEKTGVAGHPRMAIDLDKIFELKAEGVSVTKAAKELSVSHGTISKYFLAIDLADEVLARREAASEAQQA